MNDQSRSKIVFVLIFSLVIIPLSVVFFWFVNTGHIQLDLPEEGKYSVEVYQTNIEKPIFYETNQTGNYSARLRSGKYEVKVLSENRQESTYFVSVPRFLGSATNDVNFSNQGNRHKLAKGVERCTTLVGNNLYSYGCYGSVDLFLHIPMNKNGENEKQRINVGRVLYAKNYNNHLLVLHLAGGSEGEVPSLSLISGKKILQTIALPADLTSEVVNYSMSVDTVSNEKFVVSRDKNSSVGVYEKFGVEPTIIRPQEDKDWPVESLNSALGISGDRLALIYSFSEGPEEYQKDQQPKNKRGTKISVYDIKSDPQTPSTYTVSGRAVDGFICGEQYLCLITTDRVLGVYSLVDGMSEQTLFGRVDAAIPEKSGVIYQQDGGVYLLNIASGNARLLYSSEHFKLSGITYSPKGPLVNAILEDTERYGVVHTFLLDTQSHNKNVFMDDTLPYEPLSFGIVRSSDYYKDRIVVNVFLDSGVGPDYTHPRYVYDQSELDKKKGKILKELEADGFLKSKYDIRVFAMP